MPGVIDLYLARQMTRTYLTVLGVIVTVLALENLVRLTLAVQMTETPFALLGNLIALLLPEYLATAIPVAVYLSVAFAIRTLGLRGEWQMIEALGLRPRRYMLAPMLLAAISAGCQLGIRLEAEPRGERALEHLFGDIERGLYGAPFPPNGTVAIDRHTMLTARPSGTGVSGELTDVLVRHDTDVVTAGRAIISLDDAGAPTLTLYQGLIIRTDADGARHSLTFKLYRIRLERPASRLLPAVQQLDLATTGELVAQAGNPRQDVATPATAALVARIENAAFCLLLPWFALAFGVPPRRRSGGAAVFIGLLLIILFFKLSDVLQQDFAKVAIAAGLAHAALWIAVTALLLWAVRRDSGAGIDMWIRNAIRKWRLINSDDKVRQGT